MSQADALTPIAVIETDAFCEDCGFNLRTQKVWRDERLAISVCRCPECGRHHAAGMRTTAGSAWARRAALGGLVVWLIVQLAFVVGVFFAFVGFAALLNPLAAVLSPVALAVLLGYSYCKRFTAACHFVLGLALAIAPIGAWVAVRAEIAATPLLLGAAVLLWTAGFDIIYACQDAGFDREAGLFSMPARMGVGPALWISRLCHVVAVAAWVALAGVAGLGWPYLAGVALVAALLGLEHWLVRGGDLSRIDAAFFTVNSWVGVAMLAAVVAGVV